MRVWRTVTDVDVLFVVSATLLLGEEAARHKRNTTDTTCRHTRPHSIHTHMLKAGTLHLPRYKCDIIYGASVQFSHPVLC